MTDVLRRLFPPRPATPVVAPGIYQRRIVADPSSPTRLHLRIEPDGRGLMIVNASTVLHLNPTAAAHAWLLVRGEPVEAAAEWISRRFRTSRARALDDARLVRDQIEALAEGDDHDPVVVMGVERAEPFAERPRLPYRLDIALTYRDSAREAADRRAPRRVRRELDTAEWNAVLDQAWSLGIPHVVFTGGEPTLRSDLAALIRHAEALGMVTGVVTRGEPLAEPQRLRQLARAGVDHLLVVADPQRPASMRGLRRAVASDVFAAAHLTLDPTKASRLERDLAALQAAGVTHISASAPPVRSGEAVLRRASQAIADLGLILIWDLPVPFASHNPIRLESGARPEARAWLHVEPDGDVYPAAGDPVALGNVLNHPLDELWRRDGEATTRRPRG